MERGKKLEISQGRHSFCPNGQWKLPKQVGSEVIFHLSVVFIGLCYVTQEAENSECGFGSRNFQ